MNGIRYTIRCAYCETILGYVSLPKYGEPPYNLQRTKFSRWDDTMPICCPTCEVTRIMKETNKKEC